MESRIRGSCSLLLVALSLNACQAVNLPLFCMGGCTAPSRILKGNLSQYNQKFHTFLDAGNRVRSKYLTSQDKAKSYTVNLPKISSVNIDGKLNEFPTNFSGPESIAITADGKTAYTGAGDEYIYEVDLSGLPDTITYKRFTTCCDAPGVETCRPQGIRISKDGNLYFADAAGLCAHNFNDGSVRLLLKNGEMIENRPIKLPNDIDVDDDTKMVYMSDGSTIFPNTIILKGTLLHETSGRVLAYNITSNATKVLVKDLSFPNGVQLSHDKKSLIVNELNKQRVLKVELQGRRPGSFVVLTPNLPGEPDNVRAASDGSGYWVAVNLARKDDTPSFYDYLADQPCSSESFIAFNEMVASYMNFLAENTGTLAFQNVAERLSSYHFVSEMATHQGNIVKIDNSGNIVQRLTSDKHGFFSQASPINGGLFVGSDRREFLVFIPNVQ